LDLIAAKKDSLALVECHGTLGAETLDSLGQNQWWRDMKMKWKSTETTTKPTTEIGTVEIVLEKIRVRLVAPLWHLTNPHQQSEVLPQLKKPNELEEKPKQ
jgi:hypothetical protein